jgi:DNA-directed RNA polymerase I subunit RPA1
MRSNAPSVIDPAFFPSVGRPCNRLGIESSPSPFLKMSFQTATHFLTDATLQGQTDHLESPSARIVVGRVVDVGTGAFDLVQNVSIQPKVKVPAALAK